MKTMAANHTDLDALTKLLSAVAASLSSKEAVSSVIVTDDNSSDSYCGYEKVDLSNEDDQSFDRQTPDAPSDTPSQEDESTKLKSEIEIYKNKVSAMEYKIDCQRQELSKLNKKVMGAAIPKSKNDAMMAEVVYRLDELKQLSMYKNKVSDMEQKISSQREELARLNRKVEEQAKKLHFQREELANLNKNKTKKPTRSTMQTPHQEEMQLKIARQRKELAKLNKKVENASRASHFTAVNVQPGQLPGAEPKLSDAVDEVLRMFGNK